MPKTLKNKWKYLGTNTTGVSMYKNLNPKARFKVKYEDKKEVAYIGLESTQLFKKKKK